MFEGRSLVDYALWAGSDNTAELAGMDAAGLGFKAFLRARVPGIPVDMGLVRVRRCSGSVAFGGPPFHSGDHALICAGEAFSKAKAGGGPDAFLDSRPWSRKSSPRRTSSNWPVKLSLRAAISAHVSHPAYVELVRRAWSMVCPSLAKPAPITLSFLQKKALVMRHGFQVCSRLPAGPPRSLEDGL